MLTLRDTRYQDVRLVFDEGPHKYNDTLGNDYKSVTTLLGSYHNKFDKDYWLKRKAKELGISEKRIEAQWDAIKDEACARGTKTHNGLEDGSCSVTPSLASMRIRHTSLRSMALMVRILEYFSMASSTLLLRRIPAVSMKQYLPVAFS